MDNIDHLFLNERAAFLNRYDYASEFILVCEPAAEIHCEGPPVSIGCLTRTHVSLSSPTSGWLLPTMTSNQPALRLSPSLAWINPPSIPTVTGGSGSGICYQSSGIPSINDGCSSSNSSSSLVATSATCCREAKVLACSGNASSIKRTDKP